jgi:glycosyltransferase involved in cell wall biosynthesis
VKRPIICHICDFQPEYGGTFIDSLLFLNRYCQNKLQVGIFCIFPDRAKNRKWLKKIDDEGIGYGFVPRRRNVAPYVPYLLREYHPLVFHTHFSLFDLSAILMKGMLYRDSKVVWHYHSSSKLNFRQRIKDAIKLKILFRNWGDRCIAVGDEVYRSLIKAGLPFSKSVLIHNAINTERFVTNDEARKRIRASLGVDDETTVFLLLGYNPFIKGVDIFLKAAAEAIRRNSSSNLFIIIGRGETRQFVSNSSEAIHLNHTLHVSEPIEDLSLLLNGVDVLVSASRSEGLSYAVLESMSAGKLILSSNIPTVCETYGKAEGVWLFPSEDWKALSELMIRAARLPAIERKLLGNANSQYVLANHSLGKWAEGIGQVYRELLNN